jgi:hypothetical protein
MSSIRTRTYPAVLVALAAMVAVTSVAAAGPNAAKQRVVIATKVLPNGAFVLTPLQAGALKRDAGKATVAYGDPRIVMREGQSISIYRPTFTFEGKLGSLTIRERNEWVSAAPLNANGYPQVGIGTWKVVRGTGQYAQIAGGGRSGHAGLGPKWFARHEGFLTLP